MKKLIRKITNKIKQAAVVVRENVLLLALIGFSAMSDWILRVLTVGGAFRLKPLITTIAFVLIISSLIILLSNQQRKHVYTVFLILFSLLNLSHYLYYTHFNTFISVGIFKQAKHLTEMKNNLSSTFDWKAFLFVIPVLLYFYVYKKDTQNRYSESQTKNYSVMLEVASVFTLGLALLVGVSFTLTGTDISRIQKQWNREYLVEEFGIYSYSTADFIKVVTVPRTVEADYEDYAEKVNDLVAYNKENKLKNQYSNVLEGKDLYVIHYESAQTFAMDLAFSDGEVTPFLNQLAKEGMFFENFYPQHSVGTSSDTEFTFSTSLYPINNRTVFIDHADKDYSTIQKILSEKGYHVMSMHANNGGFWNRNIMHDTLGYDEFIDKQYYEIDEIVGLGLSDPSFYKQSVEILKKRKEELDQPIMSTIISLSNHYPFDELDVYGDFDTDYLEDAEIANYLKSLNYADQALELFFEEMDEAGLLDNAAVVIYGDHHAKISKSDYELVYNYDPETGEFLDKSDENYVEINNAYLRQVRKTPLIIWTKDGSMQKRVFEPTGMIDVFPTLANMLNISNPYQMGHDIFNVENNKVIFPNGSYLTKDYFFNSSNLAIYDMASNEEIMKKDEIPEEIQKEIEEVSEALELSSKMIENNLIKYHENRSKVE